MSIVLVSSTELEKILIIDNVHYSTNISYRSIYLYIYRPIYIQHVFLCVLPKVWTERLNSELLSVSDPAAAQIKKAPMCKSSVTLTAEKRLH